MTVSRVTQSFAALALALPMGLGACSSSDPSPAKPAAAPEPTEPTKPDEADDARPASETADTAEAAAPAEPAPPKKPPKKDALELTFVGDVIFGRYRDDGYDPIPEDGYDSFEDIKPLLEADVTVANLETPVIETVPDTSPIASKFRFAASRANVKMMVDAGFDVVSLANNHYFDLRHEGQRETPRIVAEEGILPVGASRSEEPLFRVETHEVEGWKIGFIALTTRRNAPQFDDAPLLPFTNLREMPPSLVPLIEEARADHDLIAVVVHWGDEYAEKPDVYTRKVAHELVDAGADLVVGHHPHVLQAVERYGNGLIAYSMGNFLFENTTEIPRLTGVLRVRYVIDPEAGEHGEACLEKSVFHSAVIARQPQKHPVPATGYLAKKVRQRVTSQGAAFDTTWTPIEGTEDLALEGLSCD